jgi:hypothetical protein
MIYRFIFLILSISSASPVFTQPGNLVENPSFEYRPECDDNNGPPSEAPPWFDPTGATSDVFHECAVQLEDPCPYPDQLYLDPWQFGVPTNAIGCQEPRTGVGYAGLFFYGPNVAGVEWREYLGVPLSEALSAGETYLVRLYVSLAERSIYAVHALQVLFHNEAINASEFGVLNYSPQLTHTAGDYVTDRAGWSELSWEYTANGTEQYMYIGNFQTNSVIDTLYALSDSIDPEDHFPHAYYYVDDVYVGTEILSLSEEGPPFDLIVFPNPVEDVLTLTTESALKSVNIYSVSGALIDSFATYSSGTFELNISSLANGFYVLEVTNYSGYKAIRHIIKR